MFYLTCTMTSSVYLEHYEYLVLKRVSMDYGIQLYLAMAKDDGLYFVELGYNRIKVYGYTIIVSSSF